MQKKEQKTHLEAGPDRHERTYDAFSGIPVQRIEETNQSSSLNLVIPPFHSKTGKIKRSMPYRAVWYRFFLLKEIHREHILEVNSLFQNAGLSAKVGCKPSIFFAVINIIYLTL